MKTKQSWILTDQATGIWVPDLRCGPKGKKRSWSVVKKVLHGGLSEGVETIEVNNGSFRFTILPTRGMGIWKGEYKGIPVGWQAPVKGPVHPMFVNALDRGGLGWLQGFDEVIVRCGLASMGAPCQDTVIDNNGNPSTVTLPLHGSIANKPASKVEVEFSGNTITVSGVVEETALFYPKFRLTTRISTEVNSNAFSIEDTVTNLSAMPSEMQLLYHCNFGMPLLDKGSTIRVPAELVAPRDPTAAKGMAGLDTYKGPTAGFVEEAFFWKPLADGKGDTLALLHNAAGDKGASVRFNTRELPAFTLWKNTGAIEDGYVTGLEPGTSYPNARPFERSRGRVMKMAAGASHRARLVLEIYDDRKTVAAAEKEIEALQGKRQMTRCVDPHPDYAPKA